MLKMDNISCFLVGTFIQWTCSVAICLPFALAAITAAKHRGHNASAGKLILLAVFFSVILGLARLDSVWVFLPLPWQSMILEAAFALAVIFAVRLTTSAGLTLNITARAWRDCTIVTALLLLFVIGRSLLIRLLDIDNAGSVGTESIALEYLLYQLTMPGIAEELSYRGIIQPGLNKQLKRPWKLMGAKVGWGWVITSLIFWAPHAFRVTPPRCSYPSTGRRSRCL